MLNKLFFKVIVIILLLFSFSVLDAQDSSNAFLHHGIAVPISTSRGVIATVDGNNKNVVLVWLFDHRGGYAILTIDPTTGETSEFPTPFPPNGDAPFASLLSSLNKYYTHFNNYFLEFDPAKRAFTFYRQTTIHKAAMSMTEDDNGVIWSVTYPKSGLVSYNPKTGEFKDYGQIYKQNWDQYPRYIAADDKGWLYFALGETASQIIAFDPLTSTSTPMIPEYERKTGLAYLYRDVNGRVYGKALAVATTGWYEFYMGKSRKIGKHDVILPKPIIAGHQDFVHRLFPDGKKILKCDLDNRRLVIEESPVITSEDKIAKALKEHFRVKVAPSSAQKELRFDYTSEGSHVMSLAATPDGRICGGTIFPMYFFSYNPKTDKWINQPTYGQWNTIARQDENIYVGGYTHGFLLEWDLSKAWVQTEKNNRGSNPQYIAEGYPAINRPSKLLAYPDSETIVLSGTPAYGTTGGGLLFWNRKTRTTQLLQHYDIITDHSTRSLLALPKRIILGGTTTDAGTGGEKKAKEAELYLMNLDTKKILWHQAVLTGVQEYSELCSGSNGLIYGIADRRIFFVFDVSARKVVLKRDITKFGEIPFQQGPRFFIKDSNQKIYILFNKGIGRIEPETHTITWLADTPVLITSGGDYLDGRIYFASGSHIYSYKVK